MKICKRRADALRERRQERGIRRIHACAERHDESYRDGTLDSLGSTAG